MQVLRTQPQTRDGLLTVPDKPPPAVRLTGVTARYGDVTALSAVDLTLARGIVGLIGPNGAGKTTLLSVVSGTRRPDQGECRLHGLSLADRRSRRAALQGFGILPQSFDLAPHMRVQDVVAYAGWCNGLRRRDLDEAVGAAIDAVGLTPSAQRRVRTLSGGERQRVGLAAATAHRPSILVLDEPTVGLDPEQRVQFRAHLAAMASDNLVLLTTHLLEDVAHVADRVLVMTGGAVVFDGTAADLAGHGRTSGPHTPGSSALELGYLALTSRGTPG